MNRSIVETFADGSTNTYVYDGDDNAVALTDENGTVHSNQFDGINRLTGKNVVRVHGVLGSTQWRFEYDGLSRRTKATDNNGPNRPDDDSVVELEYDSLSRLVGEIQNGQRIESAFDGVGNRLSLVYPNGRVLETNYDGLDHIESIRDQGSQAAVLSLVHPNSQVTETDRIDSTRNQRSVVMVLSLVYPNGRVLETNYDGLDRIETIPNQDSGAMVAEYDYIGPGRTLERRYGNGTRLSFHDGAGQDVGYDGIRRVVERRHQTANADQVAGFAYAYDQEDNRRFELDLVTDQADVYEYDSYYRLTRAAYQLPGSSVDAIVSNGTTNADVTGLSGLSETTYQLDGVGNWSERTVDGATTSFTDNVMNEYAAVGAISQTHDSNGNLTNDGSRRYSYDFANRLVRVRDDTGLPIARYAYDALGRRTIKVVGEEVTSFFYDGALSIEERDGKGTVTSQYVFGRGLDEVLQLTTDGRSYFYHDNSIGSVVALTDETGAVVERYRYQGYGENTILAADGVTPLPESTVGNPFRFTGRRFDNESGLYYYRARHYLPSRGRFLQRDPKGYVDGLGLYQYVGSNPINFVDPWGLDLEDLPPDQRWLFASLIGELVAEDLLEDEDEDWMRDYSGPSSIIPVFNDAQFADFEAGIVITTSSESIELTIDVDAFESDAGECGAEGCGADYAYGHDKSEPRKAEHPQEIGADGCSCRSYLRHMENLIYQRNRESLEDRLTSDQQVFRTSTAKESEMVKEYLAQKPTRLDPIDLFMLHFGAEPLHLRDGLGLE